ncbi:MAG: sugar ABC transporter permease [Desulfitobacteriaceae bacterium]|nr:sugar ABC transporter permease [Desulfitobacteriaceae bacterium]MDI6914305.1 sugar ABC transporter permease [Desulfitobacteriaceae bacterium]
MMLANRWWGRNKSVLNGQELSRKGSGVDLRAYTMVLALLAIWAVFVFLTDGRFISARNISMLTRQMAITSILAVGMVLVIVAGHIDLSVGSVAGFTGAVAAVLQVWYHWGTVPTILATLAVGVLIGGWQAFWVAYRGVPAFIVTLSSMLVFRGGILLITKGVTVSPLTPSFKFLGEGYVSPLGSGILAILASLIYVGIVIRARSSRTKYGLPVTPLILDIVRVVLVVALTGLFTFTINSYEGLPIPVLLLIILAVVFTFIADNTKFGRHVYAIGGNKEAAIYSGVNLKKVNSIIFILMGTLAAVAGILLTARLNAATTNAGNMFELDAIAAAILGGTSTLGGVGTIPGALLGGLIMASIDNGMSLLNIDYSIQTMVKGLILVLAVAIDIASKKKN